MKRYLPLAILLACAVIVVVTAIGRQPQPVEPIAWYGPIPCPYASEVKAGAEAFSKTHGTPVYTLIGQEATQDTENVNIEALSTRGHKGFAIYPVDAVGANGLFMALKRHGQRVVVYGAEPALPTDAILTIATDTQQAADDAAEYLIKLMGGQGAILNVLESVTDPNTLKRKAGVEAAVARHPQARIAQTISDMTQESEAINKIQSALAARGGELDGLICTGYNTSKAAASLLREWHKDPKNKRIRFVGLDTDPTLLQAIRDGAADATLAQNSFGHGYLPCLALKLMDEGWTPRQDYQFINSGTVIVTRDNVDTFTGDVHKLTQQIEADLKGKYLAPPQNTKGTRD